MNVPEGFHKKKLGVMNQVARTLWFHPITVYILMDLPSIPLHCGQYFESISLNCQLASLMDVRWSKSKLPEEENNNNNNTRDCWRELRDGGSLDTENTVARRMSITNAIDILRDRLVQAIRRRRLNVKSV